MRAKVAHRSLRRSSTPPFRRLPSTRRVLAHADARTASAAALSGSTPTGGCFYDRAMTCANAFTEKSIALLTDDYLPKIAAATLALGDEGLWWRANENSNSAGNLLLHLRGNVTQWIIGGVGGREYARQRDQEFAARSGAAAHDLLDGLTTTVSTACEIIAEQTETSLLERRQIQGYEVSVLDAIYHVVEHFSMHTGQVILLAKARTGIDLRLWTPQAATATKPSV